MPLALSSRPFEFFQISIPLVRSEVVSLAVLLLELPPRLIALFQWPSMDPEQGNDASASVTKHSFLDSSFPVLLPVLPELRSSQAHFEAHVQNVLGSQEPSDVVHLNDKMASISNEGLTQDPFIDALLKKLATVATLDDRDGQMPTENGDVAYSTSGNALVNLFSELETVVSSDRLKLLLDVAWKEDPDATLRLIWNCRSIHLGKGDITFYRAAGWLAQNHPQTLLVNLEWLVRPVIHKKAAENKTEKGDVTVSSADDFEIVVTDVGMEGSESPKKKRKVIPETEPEIPEFHVQHGVSHSYWKDLLNLLSLAARDKLTSNLSSDDIHCILEDDAGEQMGKGRAKKSRDWTLGRKKTLAQERHQLVVAQLLQANGFYRTFHVTVARIIADQLKLDLDRVNGSKAEKRLVSLCGKWAPTPKKSHDRHTFIVSSIAELLYEFDEVCPGSVDPTDRETYLKYARRAYQASTLSKLRKHLDTVERPISEDRFRDIKYDRVPSLAMKRYASLFRKKDQENFEQYIAKVATGKARILGATLLPSTLVHNVRVRYGVGLNKVFGSDFAGRLANRKQEIEREVMVNTADGQWKTLCQRIKDSGKLESSIAVCDVSGSMYCPVFKDGTCPIDSAIGLSLLLAEVSRPPFGGTFITFSILPEVVRVGGRYDERSFKDKVDYIASSRCFIKTDFVAIFETVLLPIALNYKLKPEHMVKQVFVFSDRPFNEKESDFYPRNVPPMIVTPRTFSPSFEDLRLEEIWSTSFQRIKNKFEDAGYQLPRLIFWNLASGRNNGAAPKPVTADEDNTTLVNGYSQGQLKMFLENGSFEDEPEEIVEKDEDGAVAVDTKKSMDPAAVMREAISHEAYRMLKVVD
ncbi:hypothetical protein SCARD494_00237 [Seiridium cardinale]